MGTATKKQAQPYRCSKCRSPKERFSKNCATCRGLQSSADTRRWEEFVHGAAAGRMVHIHGIGYLDPLDRANSRFFAGE